MHQNGQCIFVEHKCACEGCDKEKTGNEAPGGASFGVFGKLEYVYLYYSFNTATTSSSTISPVSAKPKEAYRFWATSFSGS